MPFISTPPSIPLDSSEYSVTPSQLQQLYEQHWQMKEQIDFLKKTLFQCETKWNNIVNSMVKENVELKSSEDYYKKKYRGLVQKLNQKKTRKSQELIIRKSQELIRTQKQPLSSMKTKDNQSRMSMNENIWKTYINCDNLQDPQRE